MLKLSRQNLLATASYINGQWVGASQQVVEVTNPANGELIASIPSLGAPETRDAIAAAKAAFPAWSSRPAKERAKVLRRWYEFIIIDITIDCENIAKEYTYKYHWRMM